MTSLTLFAAAWLVSPGCSDDWNEHEAAKAAEELRSEDPTMVAFGCHRAMAFRVVELAPSLVEVAEHPPRASEEVQTAVQKAALDALIQLRQSIPPAAREALRPKYPVQCLILALNDRSTHRDHLLDLVRRPRDSDEWNAAANALVGDRDQGVAEVLLADLELRLEVLVYSGMYLGAGGGAGGGFGGHYGRRGGVPYLPPGFPPVASYHLSQYRRAGNVVLAEGPRTIYYSRRLSRVLPSVPDPDQLSQGETGDINGDRHRLLLDMAGYVSTDDAPALLLTREESIHARRGTDYQPQLDALVAEVEASFDALVTALRNWDRVSARFASSVEPKLEVKVEDVRRFGLEMPDWKK